MAKEPEDSLAQTVGNVLAGIGLIALPILVLIVIALSQEKKEEEGG